MAVLVGRDTRGPRPRHMKSAMPVCLSKSKSDPDDWSTLEWLAALDERLEDPEVRAAVIEHAEMKESQA